MFFWVRVKIYAITIWGGRITIKKRKKKQMKIRSDSSAISSFIAAVDFDDPSADLRLHCCFHWPPPVGLHSMLLQIFGPNVGRTFPTLVE